MTDMCARRLLYINDDFYTSAEELDMFDQKQCFEVSKSKTLSDGKYSTVKLITIEQTGKRYIIKYGRSQFYQTCKLDKWLLYFIELSCATNALHNVRNFDNLSNLFRRYGFGTIERDVIMSLFVSSLKLPHTPRVDFIYSNDVWSLGICMKYRKSRDLFTCIQRMDSKLLHIPFKQKMKWAYDIFNTVKQLHDNNIAHMDIALENIIVDCKTNDVVLIDYGFSMFVHPDNPVVYLNTAVGRDHYISYEILKLLPVHPLKADIFALGILLFSLFLHVHPYELRFVRMPDDNMSFEPNDHFYELFHSQKEKLKERMIFYASLRQFVDYPDYFFDELTDLLCDHMIDLQCNISTLEKILLHPFFQHV